MNRCNAFLKRAAFLFALAAGASAQEQARECPSSARSSVLLLSAKPASVVLNVPTTVRFQLVAVGKSTVRSARLIHGSEQSSTPMTAMASGQLGFFSAQAVITATRMEPVTAVAEVRQQLDIATAAVTCVARSNLLRLAVTAAPAPAPPSRPEPRPRPRPEPEPEPEPPPEPAPAPPVLASVSAQGVSLRYPPNWNVNRAVVAEGGPLALNNFDSRYLPGGIAPKGGAEIDITYTQRPASSVQQALAKDLPDVTFIISSQVVIDGSVGTQVWYQDDFGPGLFTTNAAVYVPRGRFLYKFFLTFHARDPSEKTFAAQFRQILHSVQFKEPR